MEILKNRQIMDISGRRFLKSRSPLYFANRVKNPLMIVHGANDPRVKQAESGESIQ
jgi:dipeptidyl aminopeptidase/acylaminoacyl peptidase